MSDKSANLFGWDLLYGSVASDIKNNQDVLVCFVHLVLISNGFKCVGLGDSKNLDGNETKTESLPKGWNDGYAIRYVYQGRLYNLKGTSLEDGVIINLVRVDERNVSMVQLNTRLVTQKSGSLDQMIADSASLLDIIKKQLIDKVVVSSKSKDSGSQTQPTSVPGPAFVPTNVPSPLYEPSHVPRQPFSPLSDPLNVGVGRSDLDPFGLNPLGIPRPGSFMPAGGGGGMFFVPPQGPRFDPGSNIGIPGGSLPPGARFDPFRPPDVDRFPRRPHNPDNDEMPPPGFDNMFM